MVYPSEEESGYSTEESNTAYEPFVPSYAVPCQDLEEWSDYWSEELAILYHVAKDQCDGSGWAILDRCSFPDFVEFCYKFSSKFPPKC